MVLQLIEQRTGIKVQPQHAIAEVLARLPLDALARSRDNEPIWQSLLDTLTVGETYFLRDHAQFAALRGSILPQLLQQRRHLHIWSAGCATGEEPYSIAITLRELQADPARVTITGSDLNGNALNTARRGLYRAWAFRLTDDSFRGRYFTPVQGRFQIKPEIQRMVTFRQENLLTEKPVRQFDLIFCRNVLLYFSHMHKRLLENQLFDALRPGGWLVLGQAEGLRYQRDRWTTHTFPGATVYQKPQHVPVAHSTPPAPTVTYEDAVRALQDEDTAQAARLLNQLPETASRHLLTAYLKANQGDNPHPCLDQALSLDPLLADAHYLRALLYLEAGDVETARRSFNAALYCQRNHPMAAFMLGNLHAQAGDLPRAVRAWENALKAIHSLTPDSPVSDISSVTAGQLKALVQEQLRGWQT